MEEQTATLAPVPKEGPYVEDDLTRANPLAEEAERTSLVATVAKILLAVAVERTNPE